jgi:hypothetical protein
MLTMRPIEKDGSWGAKSRTVNGRKINTVDWNDRDKAEQWRRAWAAYANGALRMAGLLTEDNVLDHRSYARQGKEQIPTIHMGVAATQMERKGIRTERGNLNREIERLNSQLRQSKARIRKLQNWLKDERADKPPTLADVLSAILNQGEYRSQNQKIYDLKLAARALIFVQENHVETLADMTAALDKMQERNNELRGETFKLSRRLPVLTEHLKHADNYSKYQKIYRQYYDIKGNEQDKFYDKHSEEITAWLNAHKHFDRVMNGRKSALPVADWKREFADLTAERQQLLDESQNLTAELKNAEAIKRFAEKVMGVETTTRKRTNEIGG